MIQISTEVVNGIVEMMNAVASDKMLTAIERKVKIANKIAGEYKTICGKHAIVYRSPNNRTLLAIKGDVLKNGFIKVDLLPTQVLTILMSN